MQSPSRTISLCRNQMPPGNVVNYPNHSAVTRLISLVDRVRKG